MVGGHDLLLLHRLTPYHSLRRLFGNTVIAGGVTVAFIFFASEYLWRRWLPEFFPRGDLSAVRRVPRFTVRVRLLAIFLLIGVVPLAVLGMVAYTRAVALVGADPATAASIVDGLRITILFLLGVGVAAAVGLSVLAAHSVAAPLKDVEAARGHPALRGPARLHPVGGGHRAPPGGARPQCVLHRDGPGDPRPRRPRAPVHRR